MYHSAGMDSDEQQDDVISSGIVPENKKVSSYQVVQRLVKEHKRSSSCPSPTLQQPSKILDEVSVRKVPHIFPKRK